MPDVKIRLVATDESGRVFEGAIGNVDDLTKSAREARAAWSGMGRAVDDVARLGARGINVFNRLDIQQLTVTQSAERVARAQQEYLAVLREHGPASEQAAKAQAELAAAQDAAQKVSSQSVIKYAAVGAEVIGIATKAPAAIAGLSRMAAQLNMVAISGGRARAAMIGVAGAAGLVAVAAVGLATLSNAVESYNRGNERGLSTAERLAARERELAEAQSGRVAIVDDLSRLWKDVPDVIPLPEGHDENLEKLEDEVEDLRTQLALETEAQNIFNEASADAIQLEEDLAAEIERQNAARAMQNGLAAAGIDLRRVDLETLRQFVPELAAERDAETAAAAAALQSSEALRAQAAITKEKDETTEAFVERLKSLGFTEEDLAARLNETGDALLSQADATLAAAAAADTLESTSSGAGLPGLGGSAYGPGSAMSFAAGPTSSDRSASTSRTVNKVKEGRGTPLGNALEEEFQLALDQLGITQMPTSGFLGRYGKYVQEVRAGGGDHETTAKKRAKLLAMLGVTAAADGMDSMVTDPTLILAGEAGPEHVKITPRGRQKAGGTLQARNVTINNYFRKGEGNPESVTRVIRASISTVTQRLAARGSK